MTDPLSLRDAVVAQLQLAVPAPVKVEAHDGTFDEAELKRWMGRAPAVLVAVPGVDRMRRASSGMLELPVRLVAVIIAKDRATPKQSRGDVALSLATLVSAAADGNQWGLDDAATPEELEARNEFTSRVDAAGVALWQVMWCQAIRMGTSRAEVIGALQTLVVNGLDYYANGDVTGADPVHEPAPPQEPQP